MSAGLLLPVALLFLSAWLSLHLFLFLRARSGESRSAWLLASLMGATAFWAFFNALELLAQGLEAKFVLGNLQYIAISAIPVLQFRFGTRLLYRDDDKSARLWSVHGLLWIEPILTSVLVWFDPALGWVRHDLHLDFSLGFAMLSVGRGPWFWVHAVYDYALIAIGTGRVIMALSKGSQNGRAQAWILSFAALVPTFANLVYIVGFWPIKAMDPTPMAFTLTGLAYLFIFSRFRFLALLPVAQDVAIAGLEEGVLILDRDGRVVFMNSSARKIPISRGSLTFLAR